jgi:hypothetical protein
MKCADLAMYRAKQTRRRHAVYEPSADGLDAAQLDHVLRSRVAPEELAAWLTARRAKS